MSLFSSELPTFAEKITKKWDYETFREYLLAQARGLEFLLSIEEFPKEIKLSDEWYETFNIMREATKVDGIERLAMVGFNFTNRTLLLPTQKVIEVPWSFSIKDHIPEDAIRIQDIFLRHHGAGGLTGVLHSHPDQHSKRILGMEFGNHRLSAGDLYNVLVSEYGNMIGVAAGSINSLAFRTKESIHPTDDQRTFYDLWEHEPQPRNLDILIAKKYKLALFRGAKNKPLKRIA